MLCQPDFLFTAFLEENQYRHEQQQASNNIAPCRNTKATEIPLDKFTPDKICLMYTRRGIVVTVERDSHLGFLRSCPKFEDSVIIRIVQV